MILLSGREIFMVEIRALRPYLGVLGEEAFA
jgi:hypothetical protein